MKIIPIYENKELIPRLLRRMLTVKFIKDDFENFIQKVFF